MSPTTLYAGSSGDRVYKSIDAGATWSLVYDTLNTHQVNDLAMDPTATSTLYAATWGGVFKSTDAGASWNIVFADCCVFSLAVDPIASAILYAATLIDGMFKSTDAGAIWTAVNTGAPGNRWKSTIAIDPVTPTTLYYSDTNGTGILKSLDAGASWNAANNGLMWSTGVYRVAIDPATPSTLYAATWGGVFKSGDAGANWNAMATLGSTPTPLDLAIDPGNPRTLYAGMNGTGVNKLTQFSDVTGSMDVNGDFIAGGTVFYTVTLANIGFADQSDNPGDEFIIALVPDLTLVSATVMTGGGVVATPALNTITWNGPIPWGEAVEIEIEAIIGPDTEGQVISNQGQVSFDSDDDGVNDSQRTTESPKGGGPTTITVFKEEIIPTLSAMAMVILAFLLAATVLPRKVGNSLRTVVDMKQRS